MAKENKSKKENKHFFKDFKAELKKVIWPTPKQLVNNTVAVITIVLITAAIVFVLDFAFEKMNTYGINKIKSMVESNNTVSESTNTVENVKSAASETENTADQNDTVTNSEVAE